MSFNNSVEASEQAAEISTIFGDNPRFQMVKVVAYGAYGAAFRIRVNHPDLPNVQDLLIKRAFPYRAARDALVTEKRILEVCTFEKRTYEYLNSTIAKMINCGRGWPATSILYKFTISQITL